VNTAAEIADVPRGGARTRLDLLVSAVAYESPLVLAYELRSPDDFQLPPFTAGAHIDLHLPNGLNRSYSLCNSPRERDRYVIGVQRDPHSRGGSAFIHDHVRPGGKLTVSAPCNNFELVDHAGPSVLIAGGIGITPLMSMIRVLEAQQREWQLHYAARERQHLSFSRELRDLAGGHPASVSLHVDAEKDGAVLDIARIVSAAPANAHFYCCGPIPMLESFKRATADLPDGVSHAEYFTNDQLPDTAGGFEVELAVSGLVLQVRPGSTILQTIEGAGIPVDYSCTEGVCGTCETRVLAGVPDHRDQVLSDREKAANDVMMICCSGCKSSRLVLDL
jgi:tetrachlorobenzoquinone reductase